MTEIKGKPGRKPGSTNKVKKLGDNSIMLNINMEKQIPNAPTCRLNPQGFINWGTMNDFPQMLTGLYYSSSTHKSCIDFLVTAICGEGIDTDSMMPNYGETWESFLNKLAMDLVLFGGYSFQVIMNKDGKTYSFFHEPFNNVRCGNPDEDGNVSEMWICKDWTETAKNRPFVLPRFGFNEDEKERKEVINSIQKMFTGAENSNTIMITFKNNDEDNPVTFTPFDKDSSNVNLFADNNSRTVDRILSAHRIANPTLIGLPNSGTGFANEGALLEASFNLLNKTVINNMRKEITMTINKMFKINGVDDTIKITPLSFNLSQLADKVEVIEEDKTVDTYNNDNIVEKEV